MLFIDADGALKRFPGLRHLSQVAQRAPQIAVCIGIVGVEVQGVGQGALCGQQLPRACRALPRNLSARKLVGANMRGRPESASTVRYHSKRHSQHTVTEAM